MVTRRFLCLSYRFGNAIIDFLDPQVVTFKKMHDSIGFLKNRSYWLMWLTISKLISVTLDWSTHLCTRYLILVIINDNLAIAQLSK